MGRSKPNAKWVVEIYRDGEIIHQLATDSANADGYNQIQAPDGSRQYGNGVWWASSYSSPKIFRWVMYGKYMGGTIWGKIFLPIHPTGLDKDRRCGIICA